MLPTGEILISSRSGGERVVAVSMCSCLGDFLLARSDEMFVDDSRAVHSAYCLTRGGVAFHADGTQLQFMRWRQLTG